MSVFNLFGALKGLFQTKNKAPSICNYTFLAHRTMAYLLLGASIVTCSKQFFGDYIKCKGTGIMSSLMNEYCFMTGTYTVIRMIESENDAHRGISADPTNGRRVTHHYYQWVPFILFFQAAFFYMPYRIWKYKENGKLQKIVAKVSMDPLTETPLGTQVESIAKFLLRSPGWYNKCARVMVFCEFLLLFNALFQLYLVDLTLGHTFFRLGVDYFTREESYHALEDVFPLVTKCSMNFTGPTGSVIADQGICTLPINIVNQKIFLGFWLLDICLILFSIPRLLLSLCIYFCPCFRFYDLRIRVSGNRLPYHIVSCVHRNLTYGDHLLMKLIDRHVDSTQFEALVMELYKGIQEKRSSAMDDSSSFQIMDKQNMMESGTLSMRNSAMKGREIPPAYTSLSKH